MADKTILDLTHTPADSALSSIPHHRTGQSEAESCTPRELVRAGADATATASGVPQANTSGVIDPAYLPVATTSTKGGVILATGGGSTTGTVVQATDPRLSDSRAPTAHTHAASDITSGTVAPARLGSGTADSTTVLFGDSVYRTPTAAVTLREADGSPSLIALTIEFLQSQGFVVTDQGSGVGRVSMGDADTTNKGVVKFAPDYGTTSGTAVNASDPRMSNARPPSAHAASHQNGGGDEIATATPAAHVIPKTGSGGQIAVGFLASGTPDGTKFVRDDGTLATPSGGGGGSLTIQELDGSPSISAATVLQFDQGDGFAVTNPSGTTAKVKLTIPDATTSSHGLATLAALGLATSGAVVQANDPRIPALPGHSWTVHEHFIDTGGSGPFWANVGSQAPLAAEAGHPGIQQITSPHTDPTPASLTMVGASSAPVVAGDVARWGGWVRSGDSAPGAMKVGLSSDVNTFGNNAVYFDRSLASNWHAVCRASSTSTSTDTGVSVASGTWYFLEAVQTVGVSWEFFINGASVATITTNRPSAALFPEVWVDHEVSVDHSIDVDNFYLVSVSL